MDEKLPIIRQIEVKSVISKSNIPNSDFTANPYVGCTHACKYCYASFMKRFTAHKEPWGCFMDVKYWPTIKNPQQYSSKKIFISSVTDPYNPQEAIYGRTQALLEQLQGSGAKIIITTKSDLIIRDLELIKSFPDACVAWSINTLNDSFRKDMDKAASISRRLTAMAAFHQAGIRTVCFISPIFPFITNVTAIIQRVKNQCNQICLENLNLRNDYKDVIMDYIQNHHHDLYPFYQEIYKYNNYRYWDLLDHELIAYAAKQKLEYIHDSITTTNSAASTTNNNSIAFNPPRSQLFVASPLIVNLFHYGSPNPNKTVQAKNKHCNYSITTKKSLIKNES